jgi:hypothetical protein
MAIARMSSCIFVSLLVDNMLIVVLAMRVPNHAYNSFLNEGNWTHEKKWLNIN